MNRRIALAALALGGVLTSIRPEPGVAQQSPRPETEYEGAAALGIDLRRLGMTARVLMIAAHPDDENTALLTTLALGKGADVAYLSLTRGEGGQNGIGPELQEGLGLLRTEELLAARRLDGAVQFFTRAYDFGFSKSAEEAFQHWPRDTILSDVVRVIRSFRPHIIVAVFSGTPNDGHGQHQVSGIMAREAYEVAGDAARFPEQLRAGLRPWAPLKLYQASWRNDTVGVRIQTGELDPLVGRSYSQVAAGSRSRHRSQDMGSAQQPGPRIGRMRLLARRGGAVTADEPSIFVGVDSTLSLSARATSAGAAVMQALQAYDAEVERLRGELNVLSAERLVPGVGRALGLLARADSILARATSPAAADLRFRIAGEREDAEAVLARTAGLVLDAVADDERIVPGQPLQLDLTLWNGGTRPVVVRSLEPRLPEGWRAEPVDSLPTAALEAGSLITRKFRVQVPANASPTEPYFLRQPRDGDLYRWPASNDTATLPFEPPPVRAVARVSLAGATIEMEREATFREVHQAIGEMRRALLIVPPVSLLVSPSVSVLASGERSATATASTNGARGSRPDPRLLRLSVRITAEAPQGIAGTLRIDAPSGWRVEPASLALRASGPGESRVVDVSVRPPAKVAPGEYRITALFETDDGRRYDRGYQLVAYPHIRPRPLYQPAVATVRAFDVQVPERLRVGYIAGPVDEGVEALAQLGVAIEPLDAQLASADLSVYDAILIGSRAYETRPDLVAYNKRLLDYAENGGTVVVLYQQYQFIQGNHAPHRLSIRRPHDRVTDERAPVELLEQTAPALSWPNRISDADFDGWIQERGLYFANTWDTRYTPLLQTADPGETPLQGGLLVSPLGKGKYVYTGLALFRQLPVGVPGGVRLMVNLLSLGVAGRNVW